MKMYLPCFEVPHARYLNSPRRSIPLLIVCWLALGVLMHTDDAVSVHLRDLGYLTRPLWDKPGKPFERVIRLATPSQSHVTEAICLAHGLELSSPSSPPPRVVDATIFSVELDLFQIRLHELYDAVDTFLIVESNVTFSGQSKPLTFRENMSSFSWAKEKIVYRQLTDLRLYDAGAEDPFENEIRMRIGVSTAIDELELEEESILLMSDTDEIPSAAAVKLLKNCQGWSDVIHLGMPSYLYSFEFPMERTLDSKERRLASEGTAHGPRQWRASAKRYRKDGNYTGYTHGRQSDIILENAGWHCSFCFRYLQDFIFKMTSFSHNDRVTSPKSQLAPKTIQDKICAGRDLFDMLPEAYDFSDLMHQWGGIKPVDNTEGLPDYLLENRREMGYLLPGGCRREVRPT